MKSVLWQSFKLSKDVQLAINIQISCLKYCLTIVWFYYENINAQLTTNVE